MKDRKYGMAIIPFRDRTGLEKHFAKMAGKGWLIESMSNFTWTYRRIEPQRLHFTVAYYPKASAYAPVPSEGELTFREFCAHTGWQFACSWQQMQVFCNDRENPVPIDTDPVLEVQTIHAAFKRNYLIYNLLLLAAVLLWIAVSIAAFWEDPVANLAVSGYLLQFCGMACLALIPIGELTAYFTWYRSAKKAAKNGLFLDTPGTTGYQVGLACICVLAFALWLLELALGGRCSSLLLLLFLFLCCLGAVVLVRSIPRLLRRWQAPANVNRAVSTIGGAVAFLILAMLIVAFAVQVADLTGLKDLDAANKQGGATGIFYQEDLPLTVEDMLNADPDNYTKKHRSNESVFLGHYVGQQRKVRQTAPGQEWSLMYTVAVVKMPFLYDWCREQYLQMLDCVGIDASAWSAEEAYRLLDEQGNCRNSYLLCYEDRIVLIHFSWEPGAAHKAITAEKLNP